MKTEEIENEPLDTGLRTVRNDELKAIKAALELGQFYASEHKPRDEEDEAKTIEEQTEIASAINMIRAMIKP